MSDELDEAAGGGAAGALPRARVLSYVATADTPTRVRIVAGRTLRVAGWILVSIGICLMGWLVVLMIPDLRDLYRGGHRYSESWSEMLWWDLEHFWAIPAAAIYAGSCGITLLASAGPVSRGRKAGCYLSSVALFTVIAWFLLIGAATGALATMEGAGVGEPYAKPVELWWFAGTAVSLLIALLLWDLIAFLGWIARNPVTEKPAVPFMPERMPKSERTEK